ncbi:YgjV family protein [Lactobacillus agilis]|uniref:YgjV family protein n=1 Tax=Ligilactobacillus agilis TaxID=1601 RepID=UPI001430634A|nr:YgjV family protein [Ligilactobacillus agilis]MDO4597271.1 YgjV family protein [Ligilactobacillus agilis]NJE33010.1 YgjV family protein [Ligilactobacillus agilis]
MVHFILVQAVCFLGTIIFFLSYQCRSNRNLFRMQLASYCCYMIHMFLLGALTGGTSYILNVVRSYCLSSRSRFLHSWQMCGVICCLQLVTLYLTWSNWWSLLPIIANIATTIGEYTYNSQKIRLVGLAINSPLKISYDFLVGSWAGIFDELVTLASVIISIWRYGWKNLDRVEEIG